MSDDNNNQPSPSPPSHRRSSFAGQTLAELFGVSRQRSSNNNDYGNNNGNQSNPVGQQPGTVASAAAQAQRRRMSTTAIGIGGSPSGVKRNDSLSSANSSAIDESAVEDGDAPLSQSPTTPFARRMSFGARALRDVRSNTTGGGGNTAGGLGGGGSSSNGRSSVPSADGVSAGEGAKKTPTPTAFRRESGYNWADSFRNRAERSSSIASSSGGSPNMGHSRAKSIATMQPVAPVKEAPRPNVPDHFQERILKGDFYMD